MANFKLTDSTKLSSSDRCCNARSQLRHCLSSLSALGSSYLSKEALLDPFDAPVSALHAAAACSALLLPCAWMGVDTDSEV